MPGEDLHAMLYDALTSQASRSGFVLGEDAAEFIVSRAIQNIQRDAFNDDQRYAAALEAIAELPELDQTIKRQTASREFPDRASVVALMETCTGPYPWCNRQ